MTCPDSTRRGFLRQGGCALAAMATALALPGGLAGLPVRSLVGVEADTERSYPLPSSDSVNVDHKAEIIVVRFHNNVYAFSLACPHQHAAVKWVANKDQFQCTKHDSHYEADGLHISGRATRNLDRYALRRDGNAILVDINKWYESDKDPVGWAGAAIQV